MKVAIVGGGFAGLLTACLLEKKKIDYLLFEEKRIWGKSFSYPALILKRDYQKLPKHIKKLLPKPSSFASNAQVFWHGNIGQGLENKLISYLPGKKVKLFSSVDIYSLKNKFDFIINATGNPLNTRKVGLWQDWGTMHFRAGYYTTLMNPPEKFFKKIPGNHPGFVLNMPIDRQSGVLMMGIQGITFRTLPFYWDFVLVKDSFNVHFVEINDWMQNFGLAKPFNFQNIFFVGLSGISSSQWYRNDYLAILSVLKALDFLL
ncbi:hypothetical protein ciss_18150 [Carboxydothermus islandicus]|uniref:Uncharacterized protein n=1 Tax=Carboxydothermus islandicus TaxID=661089 RepID=A0A1L8D3Z1_9THEO|nr:FAD/NAD(P)-binding protein [Carboxydothermus islandicus]GAV25882.1 hypothetical protein ciss_18150 [Carboxydothermus islandicus]